MEKRLGRGLASLLPAPDSEERPGEIAVHRIRPNPFQPRKEMSESDLEQLSRSIANHGVLQPIVVRPSGDAYELIAGERRWRAARLAGLKAIPAVVRAGVADSAMLELALVENVQRRDLNPIERAEGYRQLMQSLGITQEAVAAKVGLRRSTIANHLRLLELPEAVQEAVGRHALTMGHARALLGLPVQEDRIALMEEAIRDDLSVREVERRVRSALATGPRASEGRSQEPAVTSSHEEQPWVAEVEDRLRRALGTRVELGHGSDNRGKIVIEYYDISELNRLLEQLAPSKTL